MSYLEDRTLIVAGNNRTFTCGIIGPTLWNLFYDELLRQPMPQENNLLGFADDVVLEVVAYNAELLEQVANLALAGINE